MSQQGKPGETHCRSRGLGNRVEIFEPQPAGLQIARSWSPSADEHFAFGPISDQAVIAGDATIVTRFFGAEITL